MTGRRVHSSILGDFRRDVADMLELLRYCGRCDYGHCQSLAAVVIMSACEARGLCDRHAAHHAGSLRTIGAPHVTVRRDDCHTGGAS